MSSSSISESLRYSLNLSHFEHFERSVLTVSEQLKEGEPINPDDLSDIETFLEDFGHLRDETSDEDWETTSEVLFATLGNLNGIVRRLNGNVETLRQENVELKKRLNIIEDGIKHLESSTKTDQLKLVLGQVAFDVDQSIPKLILNPVVGTDHHVTNIKDMQLALQGHEDFEDVFNSIDKRRDCQQKWLDLKTEIGWHSSLLRYMKSLKKNRLCIAHPTLSEDTVRAAMDHIEPSDKEIFKKLLAIHKKIHQHLELKDCHFTSSKD